MHSQLFLVTRFFFLFFGLVCFGSGSLGFVKSQSVASLVAGGISGVLLFGGAILFHYNWHVGDGLCLLVSLALLGRFAPALLRGKYSPAGYMVPLALVGVVLGLMLFLSPAAHP